MFDQSCLSSLLWGGILDRFAFICIGMAMIENQGRKEYDVTFPLIY